MTSSTINLWLSAGKPLTAVLLAQLCERGDIALDDTVRSFLPAFAVRGKESITLRHLLVHTAGFRFLELGWPETSWTEVITRICEMPLDEGWQVGKMAGYQPQTSWFILGEILQRITGQSFDSLIRQQIIGPLGLRETFASMTLAEHEACSDRLGWTWNRVGADMVSWDQGEFARCCVAAPGSSMRGPIRSLGRFYEMLLNEGENILKPETVAEWTRRQRVGMFDETLMHIVDFGLSFIVDSKQYGVNTVPYGFGPHCSSQTYGHGGSQSSLGFCDLGNRLVVAWLFNGRPGEGQHQRRLRALNEAIYTDLRLA